MLGAGAGLRPSVWVYQRFSVTPLAGIGQVGLAPGGRHAEWLTAGVFHDPPLLYLLFSAGAEELEKSNPNVVYTHITGYGSAGPYSHRPGLDPMAQALTGMERAQGGTENPPVFLGRISPADYAAAFLGTLGTVLALYYREHTGTGQRVETNLLDAGILLGSEAFTRYDGRPPRKYADKGQYGLGPLYRLYETAAGWIYLIAETQEEWEALCKAIDREDLAFDARFKSPDLRVENEQALAKELEGLFASRAGEEWLRLLQDAGVPCAEVVEEYETWFFSDPQAIANDMIVEHMHAEQGPLKYSDALVAFPGSTTVTKRVTPLLGEHTVEVLEEAGYARPEVKDLAQKGVINTSRPVEQPTGLEHPE